MRVVLPQNLGVLETSQKRLHRLPLGLAVGVVAIDEVDPRGGAAARGGRGGGGGGAPGGLGGGADGDFAVSAGLAQAEAT
jgi:hypothetical protein